LTEKQTTNKFSTRGVGFSTDMLSQIAWRIERFQTDMLSQGYRSNLVTWNSKEGW
jgi:hypothetical protein